MFLHASELKFKHPASNESMQIVSEIPNDFDEILNFSTFKIN
jgi:hypothetical protein